MKGKRAKTIAGFCLGLLIWVYGTTYAQSEPSFFERKEEGWFFYNEETEPEPEPEEEIVPPKPPPPPEPIALQPETETEPLSAEWFRKNFDKYKDRAVDNPTPENILAYKYLEKVMLDKSTRFAEAVQSSLLMDPFLDENLRRPLAGFGARAATEKALDTKKEVLRKIAEDVGLWFFFANDDMYSVAQVAPLKGIELKHGFEILSISLNGLPGKEFPLGRVKTDQGQAKIMGVKNVPSIFLVNPVTAETLYLANSPIDQEELEKRIILAASQAGWIPEDWYRQSRPMRTDLLMDDSAISEETLRNPADLIEALKQKVEGYSYENN